jgi:LmbE family N-acetylglucosaminyl deacetylase
MTTVLAIHAHPDDCEILAGGTLALLADAGHELTIATFTPGDCGSKELDAEAIAAVRRREAAAAAAHVKARYLCLERRDLAVFNDDPTRRLVVETLRRVRPQLVLTAAPSDYLCDHEAASSLVRDCCFGAPIPNYATGSPSPAPPLDAIPHLYFMDPLTGFDREARLVRPDFLVDVTQAFARKRAALAEHASQRGWLTAHHGTADYLDEMEAWTRARGALAGIPYGEGFRQYRGHSYPQSPLLEGLLEGRIARPL